MGENLKISRKRCKLPTIQMAERADISRFTLFQIELGNPSVASDAYFNLMRVLGLQDDFLKLAVDDELSRRLQDFELKIETDNKCAIRSLYTNGSYQGVMVFPQRGQGEWSDWGWSNSYSVTLNGGTNEINLIFELWNNNMNVDVNTALLDYMRVIRID